MEANEYHKGFETHAWREMKDAYSSHHGMFHDIEYQAQFQNNNVAGCAIGDLIH